MHCLNPSDEDYIKPDKWSYVKIHLLSCSFARKGYGIETDEGCQSNAEERYEYLEPAVNSFKDPTGGLRGINLDFLFNYELFDAESYGTESITKLSGFMTQKVSLKVSTPNQFTFKVQTTQLND